VLWGDHLHLLQYDLYVPIISPFVSPLFHCPDSTLLSVSFMMIATLFCGFPKSLAFKLLFLRRISNPTTQSRILKIFRAIYIELLE